ncbi:hypothetical protein [Coxiella burnetii]|nr:hypothetical protein [Coxiella burnetii]
MIIYQKVSSKFPLYKTTLLSQVWVDKIKRLKMKKFLLSKGK